MPQTFTHDVFTVATSPISHTLCGSITTTASFDGSPISLGSSYPPIAYDEVGREF